MRSCFVVHALAVSAILAGSVRAQGPLVLSGHAEYVNAVAFSPKGDLLAALALNEITIWRPADVPAKRLVARFKADQQITHHWMPNAPIAFTADGTKVCMATVDASNLSAMTIGLSFYTLDGKHVKTPVDERFAKKRYHWYFAFSPDGKKVACSLSGELMLRDLETGAVEKFTHFPLDYDANVAKPGDPAPAQIPSDQEFDIEDIRFLPDGKTLATVRLDGLVRFWDLKERKLIRSVQMDTTGTWGTGGGSVGFYDNATLSPNGKFGAAVSSRWRNIDTLTLWDLDGGKPLHRLATTPGKYMIRGLAWTADNKWLAAAGYGENGNEERIAIYHLETGKEALSFALPQAGGDTRHEVFSPDGRWFVITPVPFTRKHDSQVLVYDVSKITGPKAPAKPRPGRPAGKRPGNQPKMGENARGEPAGDVGNSNGNAVGGEPAREKPTSKRPVQEPKPTKPR